MKMPNFFIIGAPRCATTTLYEEAAVATRPCLSASVKEPLFSGVEGRREPFHGVEDNQGIANLSEYSKLFGRSA